MKKYSTILLSIAASLFLSTGLLAQEEIEVSLKVTKEGKVVKDTTYLFEDASEAKHAIKMMEVISGDDEVSGETKTMVFISEDGEKTEIKEIHKDSLVWIEEKKGDGKHVIVMKSDDGNTFDILVEENVEGPDVIKKKEVKVMVSADDELTWHVEGDEMIFDKDENVYIIKGDDEVKMKIKKIMEEEGKGEDVKVIVIQKEKKDCEHDEDVEVKVVKKKVKK